MYNQDDLFDLELLTAQAAQPRNIPGCEDGAPHSSPPIPGQSHFPGGQLNSCTKGRVETALGIRVRGSG